MKFTDAKLSHKSIKTVKERIYSIKTAYAYNTIMNINEEDTFLYDKNELLKLAEEIEFVQSLLSEMHEEMEDKLKLVKDEIKYKRN